MKSYAFSCLAAITGLPGELLAGRRAPGGILGSSITGLFAIFLIVGFFYASINGEPTLQGVPIISSNIAAAMIVTLWSSVSYRFSRIHRHLSKSVGVQPVPRFLCCLFLLYF